jgi:hypothetical protein
MLDVISEERLRIFGRATVFARLYVTEFLDPFLAIPGVWS